MPNLKQQSTYKFQLEGFLNLLKSRGFVITPTQYLELNKVLNVIQFDEKTSLHELRDYLCPIFTNTKKDQEEFRKLYKSYFDRFLNEGRIDKPKTPKKDDIIKDPNVGSNINESESKFDLFKIIVGLGIVLLIVGFGAVISIVFHDELYDAETGSISITKLGFYCFLGAILIVSIIGVVLERTKKYGRLILIGIFASFFGVRYYFDITSFWENLGLLFATYVVFMILIEFIVGSKGEKEKIKRKGPYSYKPIISTDKIQIINSREGHSASLPIVNSLAKAEVIDEIELPSTLDNTVRNAGFLSLALKRRMPEANYLMLIDQAGMSDHQHEWYNYIYQTLKENEAPITRYFYDTDPNHLWQDQSRTFQLHDLFDRQRLLVFGNGASFIDPILAEPYQWTQDTFSLWSKDGLCGLLTPENPVSWGYKEKALSTIFKVAPSTIDGLTELVQSFDQTNSRNKAFWVQEMRGTQFSKDIDLIQKQLPPPIFDWLCAIAIYPRIYWDLSLYIGQTLDKESKGTLNLLNRENLDILTRIPWIKEGEMGEEERIKLISLLDKDKRLLIRKALVELLNSKENKTNLPNPNSYAWEEYKVNLLRNEIAIEKNNGRKIKKIEKLSQLLKVSDSEYTELKEFVEKESSWFRKAQWNLQWGLMKNLRFQNYFKISKRKFPGDKLEKELSLLIRRKKERPQVGDIILSVNGDILHHKGSIENPTNEDALSNIVKQHKLPTISREIGRLPLASEYSGSEIKMWLNNWTSIKISNHKIVLKNNRKYKVTLRDLELIEVRPLSYSNINFPFDDISIQELVSKTSLNTRIAFNAFSLLNLSDYLSVPGFRWSTITGELRCGGIEIDGDYLPLNIEKGPDPVIGYHARDLKFYNDTFNILDIGYGAKHQLFEKDSNQPNVVPAANNTDEITYIGSQNNPTFPAPAAREGETVILPENVVDAQTLTWWNQRSRPPIEITFDLKINQNQYNGKDADESEDGFSILLASEKFVPINGRVFREVEMEQFLSNYVKYILQFKTINVESEILPSITWLKRGRKVYDSNKLIGKIYQPIWHSYKIQIGLDSIQVWINDILEYQLVDSLPADVFYYGIFAQADKGTSLMRIRNLNVRAVEDEFDQPKFDPDNTDAPSDAATFNRKLLERLPQLISGGLEAEMVVDEAGLPISSIDFSGPPWVMWFNILEEAKKHEDGILKVIDAVLNYYPDDEILASYKKIYTPIILSEAAQSKDNIKSKGRLDKEQLKTLIAQDKIDEIFVQLNNVEEELGSKFQEEFYLLKANYNNLKKQNYGGLITLSDYYEQQAKLSNALLYLINSINNPDWIESSISNQDSQNEKLALTQNEKKEVYSLIAKGKLESVLSRLSYLAKGTDSEFENQINLLRTRYVRLTRDMHRNTIGQSNYNVMISQLKDSLLQLLDSTDQSEVEESFNQEQESGTNKGAVFISYNRGDSIYAIQLHDSLTRLGVDVFVDFDNIKAGKDFQSFRNESISQTSNIISIISSSSFLSLGFSNEIIEIMNSEDFSNKKFITAIVDDSFFRKDFTNEFIDRLESKMKNLQKEMDDRLQKGENIEDLENDFDRHADLLNRLPEVIQRIRETYAVDIRDDVYEEGIKKIYDALI